MLRPASRPLLRLAPRRGALAAALIAAVALAGGCGDDGGSDDAADGDGVAVTVPINIPDVVDEVCEDVVGDIAVDEFVLGTATEPAAVDLLQAEAHLDPSSLDVTWTVAGDPATATSPRYTVTQGNPGDLTSWTVQVERVDDGTWTTTLYTSERVDDPRGLILSQEVPTILDVQPEVSATPDGGVGVTLHLSRAALPPPATVAWLFGASAAPDPGSVVEAPTETTPEGAEVEPPAVDNVFDDCSNLFGSAG